MPATDLKSSSKVKVFASDYMLDSFTSALFKTNDFSQYGMWLNHTIIPEGHPIKLSTDVLGIFFPSLLVNFGKNKNIDIHFEVRAIKNF